MTHWAAKYVGGEYSVEKDCYYWFRLISKEQFGRDLPSVIIPHKFKNFRAAKIMKQGGESFGYKATLSPVDGDAVFLSGNGKTSHHVGMAVFSGKKLMVLHAIEGAGVIISDKTALRMSGLNIMGFWRYENSLQQ